MRTATFCGIEDELLKQHELDEPSAESYFWRTRHVVADLLALWTFQLALASHERRFAEIGDHLAEPEKRLRATGKRLRQLQRDVMPLAFDLGTLERGSQHDRALQLLLRDIRQFKSIPVPLADGREIGAFSETLPELLRGLITDEGKRTAELAREVSSGLRTQGELLLASTTLRLQYVIIALTIIVGVVGILVTALGD